MQLKNFNWPTEFDSPDVPGSGVNMQKSTLIKLEKACDIANMSFVINSAYRTDAHNKKVGGVDGGAHETGHAVDIKAVGSRVRFIILSALLQAGFTRIGVYKRFIHADDDPALPQQVLWY